MKKPPQRIAFVLVYFRQVVNRALFRFVPLLLKFLNNTGSNHILRLETTWLQALQDPFLVNKILVNYSPILHQLLNKQDMLHRFFLQDSCTYFGGTSFFHRECFAISERVLEFWKHKYMVKTIPFTPLKGRRNRYPNAFQNSLHSIQIINIQNWIFRFRN